MYIYTSCIGFRNLTRCVSSITWSPGNIGARTWEGYRCALGYAGEIRFQCITSPVREGCGTKAVPGGHGGSCGASDVLTKHEGFELGKMWFYISTCFNQPKIRGWNLKILAKMIRLAKLCQVTKISAICWPLGYHLETHRLQKDAILQCSSAQFSTIWVFAIGHQMMHLATFHQLSSTHSTKHSSGKLENHQLSSLLGRSPRLPWWILVVTMSRNVPTCLGCRVSGCFHRLHRYCATTKWPNGRFQLMCSKNIKKIFIIYPACIYANVDYGDDVVVVIYRWLVVYHYPLCLRKVMLAQFFWKILNGFEWIIFQYINNIFDIAHWNTLKLPMSGQLRCPREAAVWHLVNLFWALVDGEPVEIQLGKLVLIGKNGKFQWEPFIWWEILLDLPMDFPWIFPRTSATRHGSCVSLLRFDANFLSRASAPLQGALVIESPQHLRSLVTVLRLAIS